MFTIRFHFYFLALLLILNSSCNSDETKVVVPSSAIKLTNVSYGLNSQQVFDLYLPSNSKKSSTKTLILVHGGSWTSGDKADMAFVTTIIKQNLPNYAIANINYRLSTAENQAFPMQIDDISAVISKLKNSNYPISEDFGFIGISAGGQLSLLYSYAHNSDNAIKVVCSYVGPTNFTDPNYLNNQELMTLFESVTGQTYANNPIYYQELSPFHKVTNLAPPTILFYGNEDPLVPITQGIDLHEKLNLLNVPNEFYLYDGGHLNWAPSDILNSNTKLVAFIKDKF